MLISARGGAPSTRFIGDRHQMSTGSRVDGEPTHESGHNNGGGGSGGNGHGSNDDGEKARGQQQTSNKGDGAAMTTPKFNQKISILVFRGHPEDSVDTRVAKLHLDFDERATHGRGHGQGHGGVTFEIRPDSQPVVHELVNQGPPSQRPHFLREIDVATVPVASELDTTLRDMIRGVPPNPGEWDDRNWVDDVLRVLQAAWPSQIHNCDVTYALNFMVDVLYHG